MAAMAGRDGTRLVAWAAMLACTPLAALPTLDAWRAGQLETGDPAALPDPSGGFRSLRLAGALALQAGHAPDAYRWLRRAVALAPMDAESWRLLASVERARGRIAQQAAWLGLAARLSWRDHPTQRRLMLSAFRAGDVPAGVGHADALLRLQPDDQLGLAAMMTASDDEAGQAALAAHLAASPAWRATFFNNLLIGDEEDAQGLVGLLRRMRATAAPPTPAENGTAVSKLIQAGHGGLALAYWREASGRPAGYDYLNADPDFAESLPALQAGDPGQPFGWALSRGAGVQVADGRDRTGRPALTFDGPPDGVGAVVTRSVLLAPGAYILSFAGSADGRPTARFRPRFTCAADGRTLDFDTLRPIERDGYLVARVAVAVPADCPALQLGLGLSPGDDGQVHGFALRQVHWSRSGA